MATVFFFARLWRRSGVLTDLEFYELRYSGRAATLVRGFRAVYLGLFFNCFIMASVNLAAAKIASIVLGWPMWQTLVICGVLNVAFAASSGLWGVLVVDFIQFGIAMTGAVLGDVLRPQAARGRRHGRAGREAPGIDPLLAACPTSRNWPLTLTLFVIPLAAAVVVGLVSRRRTGRRQSYIAQRMLAAKSERDALGGTLLFNVAHYALRPWPWIIVALASILVFPTLESIQVAFPNVDARLHRPRPRLPGDAQVPAARLPRPDGRRAARGLRLDAWSTHLNWGSSYLVHDFYRRFMKPDADGGALRQRRTAGSPPR
ncbi:MAG: hypothetical protein V9E87_02975 [Gemmatimonadales bacterium]